MKIIAHRGNILGPNPSTENTPKAIEEALAEGFDVEIDLWLSEKHFYYLGHDAPITLIDVIDIFDWAKRGTIYCHCKDLFTLTEFASKFHRTDKIVPFFHDKDNAILLTNGLVWIHPKAIREAKDTCWVGASIAVMKDYPKYSKLKGFYAVCTDYAIDLKNQILDEEYSNGNS